jgi:UDP-N-acetylglucosamine 2-epimerase
MLSEVFEFFDIEPNIMLDVMIPGQSLEELTARTLQSLGPILRNEQADFVLVQGDTATAFAAAYTAFLNGSKVGHVEAGLRTHNKYSPFPEEVNRKLIAAVSDLHFAPTEAAQDALLAESIPPDTVYLTGNTIVDALKLARNILEKNCAVLNTNSNRALSSHPQVLVTAHRRENHQQGLANICSALKYFTSEFPEFRVVFQVHPNPKVKDVVHSHLGDVPGIQLIDPQPYGAFIQLMLNSRFILTDSGGIQEEGPSLGKPVLVARSETERPEGISAGCNELVGTEIDGILHGLRSLATDKLKYLRMSQVKNPFGDGTAAQKIINILQAE